MQAVETRQYEMLLRVRDFGDADHVAAPVRIPALLSSAFLDVRRLDLLVANELAGDIVIQAVWKQARRVEHSRSPRSAEPNEGAVVTGAWLRQRLPQRAPAA